MMQMVKALSATETKRQPRWMQLLGEAHRRNASDVHFVVGHDITRIFFRIHGLLWEAEQHQSQVGMELCSSLYNSMCDVAKDHYQPQVSQDARVNAPMSTNSVCSVPESPLGRS